MSILNIFRLLNLKRASFADNEIVRLDGIEKCIKLESLNMEDNLVTKLSGIESLVNLTVQSSVTTALNLW